MSAGAGNPIGAEEYERHAAWLRQLARSMVADPATLDDIVQETWLSFLRHGPARDASRPESSPRPWLRRVMENAAAKFYRGEGRRASRERLAFEEPEPLESAAELAESADLVHALMGEVRELSEPLRSTVLLRYLKGLSAAEIARRSGDPEGTVRWRLSAARDELRERMDRKVGSRERWAALALPLGVQLKAGSAGLAAGQAAASAPVKAAAAVTSGAFGGRTALAGAAACALVAAGAWWATGSGAASIRDIAAVDLVSVPAATDGLVAPVGSRAGQRTPLDSPAQAPGALPPSTISAVLPPAISKDQAGVSVRLVDASGAPVPRVLVRWAGSPDVFTQTNDSGVAQLLFRPPVSGAPLRFVLEANGFATFSFPANIRAGEITPCGTRAMTRSLRRTGIVRNAEGEPVPGARVWLAPAEGRADRLSRSAPPPWPNFEQTFARTNRRGEFQFESAPSLPSRAWATAPGHWFTVSEILDSPPSEPTDLRLEALPDGTAISGRVLDAQGAPLADVLVRLVPHGDGIVGSDTLDVETAADGTFQFQPRSTERHRILVEDLLDRFDDEAMEAVSPGSSGLEIRMSTPL